MSLMPMLSFNGMDFPFNGIEMLIFFINYLCMCTRVYKPPHHPRTFHGATPKYDQTFQHRQFSISVQLSVFDCPSADLSQ